MLSLEQIQRQYPENVRDYKRSLLREYLQYKILEIVFNSEHAKKLVFIGGTAIRIVHDSRRFSEDIDFDNFGLTEEEFKQVSDKVKAGLEAEGFQVEISLAGKESYRCKVRFPGLLFGSGLSQHQDEKIMIQMDSLAQGFVYEPERKTLAKFEVFTDIFTPSPELLLSQKINAVFSRKRAKGRDFYDITYLLSFAKPDYQFLTQKLEIDNAEVLRNKLVEVSSKLDFSQLAADVEPLLFDPEDRKKVERFPDFIQHVQF